MSKPTHTLRRAALRSALLCTSVALGLSACARHAPKGQVLATVNGQEITGQDLASEARARNQNLPAPVLMQNVVARVLLAQAAHRDKLDAYPGYPSDMQRLKEDFLARRMLQKVAKPVAPATPAQISQIIATHPYQFGRRMRLDVTQLKFSGDDAARAVQGLTSLDEMTSRLNSLGVSFQKGEATLDTAQLPDALAQRLVDQPIGSIFTVKQGDTLNELVIRNKQPVDVPAAQAQAEAAQLFRQQAEEREIQGEIDQLKQKAQINYQPGYAPPKPGAAKPAS